MHKPNKNDTFHECSCEKMMLCLMHVSRWGQILEEQCKRCGDRTQGRQRLIWIIAFQKQSYLHTF